MVKFSQHTALFTLNFSPEKCCNQSRTVRVRSLLLKLFSTGPSIHSQGLFQTGCKGYLVANNRSELWKSWQGVFQFNFHPPITHHYIWMAPSFHWISWRYWRLLPQPSLLQAKHSPCPQSSLTGPMLHSI